MLTVRECDVEEYPEEVEALRIAAIDTRFGFALPVSGGGVGGF